MALSGEILVWRFFLIPKKLFPRFIKTAHSLKTCNAYYRIGAPTKRMGHEHTNCSTISTEKGLDPSSVSVNLPSPVGTTKRGWGGEYEWDKHIRNAQDCLLASYLQLRDIPSPKWCLAWWCGTEKSLLPKNAITQVVSDCSLPSVSVGSGAEAVISSVLSGTIKLSVTK